MFRLNIFSSTFLLSVLIAPVSPLEADDRPVPPADPKSQEECRAYQRQVMDYVREYAPGEGKWPLGGNTVSTDRGFLARDMPELETYLHYRIIDVSSVKELSRRWYPRAYFNAPAKNGGHRALADIRESIAELRYYREAVFVPQPGPDSNTAKAIAARFALQD